MKRPLDNDLNKHRADDNYDSLTEELSCFESSQSSDESINGGISKRSPRNMKSARSNKKSKPTTDRTFANTSVKSY